jgi:hypothetical protein
MLFSEFCLHFFSVTKVACLRREVLSFRQLEEESLGMSWDCFNGLINTSLYLAIWDPILLQHFFKGLSKDSKEFIDLASRGVFLHLPISEARSMHEKICEITPCTSTHSELLEEEKQSSPKLEEEVLIPKSQPIKSQNLDINPKPSIP